VSGIIEHVIFDFASDRTLRDKPNILRLMAAIMEETDFRCTVPHSSEYPPQRLVEITPQSLSQAWDEAINRGRYGASIGLRNSKDFGLSFGVNFAHYRQLHVMVNNGYISDLTAFNYENVRSVVRICELAYAMLDPEYGYGLITPNVHPIPDPKESHRSVQAIYDYNFFGPRLVEQLGRERVLSVPTWRTVQYDDGGVLLEMSPSPIADWKPYTSNYRKAAEILGVDKYYQGG
jgi:hypothetical protein